MSEKFSLNKKLGLLEVPEGKDKIKAIWLENIIFGNLLRRDEKFIPLMTKVVDFVIVKSWEQNKEICLTTEFVESFKDYQTLVLLTGYNNVPTGTSTTLREYLDMLDKSIETKLERSSTNSYHNHKIVYGYVQEGFRKSKDQIKAIEEKTKLEVVLPILNVPPINTKVSKI